MDRQCRAASKITNYRKYHLSGDLDKVVQGRVSGVVEQLENTTDMEEPSLKEATTEQLQELLQQQKDTSTKIQQQVEAMKLKNELEAEKLQQEQWALAMEQLKQSREHLAQQHEENMQKIRDMGLEPAQPKTDKGQALAWLQSQMAKPSEPMEDEAMLTLKRKEEAVRRQAQMEKLKKQQEELRVQMEELMEEEAKNTSTSPVETLNQAINGSNKSRTEQELLLEQIRTALGPKEEEKDPNKTLLRALISSQNKVTGDSGTSTLKTDIFNKLTNEGDFSMAEWLASLNKQEGESEVTKLLNRNYDESDCRAECKHTKSRFGMLDKSTTNIWHKEVWPHKNLGEDWAEEEIEFKQLRFEHLVAGETRTIETCSNPAQILGRLRLLRRLAYLKLRGIEWHLIRKMYAAILSSIETREYSWESNFD